VSGWTEEIHSNRWYTNFGPLNQRFETAMQRFMADAGSPGLDVGTFSSATTGLELILKAMDLPERAKVLVPALTFPATALAVINAGHEPVLGDVHMGSWDLTAETALAIHASTPLGAVMPVSAFGRPIETRQWVDFQRKTGVPVLLDAAAALGQQPVPAELTAVFSLHATKPFGVGEGGLVATGDTELLKKAKSLSNFGFLGPAGVVQAIGTNAKFGEYYAAVGLAQIDRWDLVRSRRQRILDLYQAKLAKLGNRIVLQQGVGDFIPAVFPVYVPGKGKRIHEALAQKNIQTRYWYLPLLNKHPALADLPIVGPDGLKNSEVLAEGLVGLPFHAFLDEDDIDLICNIVSDSI
jgi:dTDP-4-amino-4,6-dideoxygalactose transaminase